MSVAEAVQGKGEKIAHEEQGLLQVTGILQVTDLFIYLFFKKKADLGSEDGKDWIGGSKSPFKL